jgi:hypothetical protein
MLTLTNDQLQIVMTAASGLLLEKRGVRRTRRPRQHYIAMDASEFFREVVKSNYEESVKNPHSFRSLWNALVSMNTVAEFVALERLEYSPTSAKELMQSANMLHDKISPIANFVLRPSSTSEKSRINQSQTRNSQQ